MFELVLVVAIASSSCLLFAGLRTAYAGLNSANSGVNLASSGVNLASSGASGGCSGAVDGRADDVRFFTRFGCLSGVIQQDFGSAFARKLAFLGPCASIRGKSNTLNSKSRRKATNLSDIKVLTKQHFCR